MKLQTLLDDLGSEVPAQRIASAHTLGIVEETQALNPLRDAYKNEHDFEVMPVLEWAGKRVFAAHRRGYNTFDAIFGVYRLDLPRRDADQAARDHFMQSLEDDFNTEMAKDAAARASKNALKGAAIGGALGGVLGAALGAAMSKSSVSTALREMQSAATIEYRINPTMPSEMNYKVWLGRIRSETDPDKRQQAAKELVQLNNPDVLPHLGEIFLQESDPDAQKPLEDAAKLIYIGARYWELSQQDDFETLIEQRLTALLTENTHDDG